MNRALKEQYMQSIFRFRKASMIMPQRTDVNMTELAVMRGIEQNTLGAENNVCASEIHSNLYISKAAISQMLRSLEKKGYIIREIDKEDRRKIIVMLTPSGLNILKETRDSVNEVLEKIFVQFGEENTKHLIELLDKLSAVSENIKGV